VNGWLVDTDVVSELYKPRGDAQVALWADVQPHASLFLSIVSIAEIRFGIERVSNDARRRELEQQVETNVRQWFAGRILELDERTMLEWLRLVDVGRRSGHTFAQPDLFIAASARLNDLCVVTGNVAHFTPAGVPVFNPWQNVLEMPGRKPAKVNGPMTLDRLR